MKLPTWVIVWLLLFTTVMSSQNLPTTDTQAMKLPHFRWSERLTHELDYRHTVGTVKELSPQERQELLKFFFNSFKHPVNTRDAELFGQISAEQMRKLAADTRIELLDLNGDGIKEVIAQGNGLGPCGATGNCIVMVLQRTPAGWKSLLDSRAGKSGGGFEKVRVLETATSGFRDIVLASHDSAKERTLFVYRYADGQYRVDECYNVDWWCWECVPPHSVAKPRITTSEQCR